MVCKLVTGPGCSNGLVTGTVLVHLWVKWTSQRWERSPQVFSKPLDLPVVSFSCLLTPMKHQQTPGVLCTSWSWPWLLWTQTYIKRNTTFGLFGYAGSFLLCNILSFISFPFFFCPWCLFAFSIVSSEWAIKKIRNLPKHSSCLVFSK